MKGKSVFTPEEAIIIKSNLHACREAGRYAQKDLRDALRKVYSFYISDFDRSRNGFTSADFDYHVSIGNIKIEEDPHVTLLNQLVSFDYESDVAKSNFEELTKKVESHNYISEHHKQLLFGLLKEVKIRIPAMIVN